LAILFVTIVMDTFIMDMRMENTNIKNKVEVMAIKMIMWEFRYSYGKD